MRTSEGRVSRVAHRLSRRGLHLALLMIGLLALQASECSKEDFYNPFGGSNLLTGNIFGRVTVGGSGRSDVTVTVRQGTTVAGTDMTDGNGDYRVVNLDPGTYTVSIPAITGADCPGDQTATVVADDDTQVNFACTAQPQTGTVTGEVTVNDEGEPGVTVTLRLGTTTIETTATANNGTFQFTNVVPGTKTVQIETPEGATCATTSQDVTVPAGGTATANFPCTRPTGDFTVGLNNPPPGWNHDMPGVSSLECKVIQTTPAQPGASFSATATGPTEGGPSGVLTPQPVTGTLDASGRAQLQVRINRLGTYQNTVTVTVGSVTRSATQTITVLSTPNTCPAISSLRFKRGVMALLPDDVRPLGLRPVAFRYREPWGDPAEPQIGLIAEEVVEVFPEAVLRDAEGRPDMIDYRVLSARAAEEAAASVGRAVGAGIARWAERF